MSTVVITRPFSQNLSNLSSTSPFEGYNFPQRRTTVRSHYRPYSTLYLEEEVPRIAQPSSSVLIKPRRHSIYRSASVGGAHALANMGLAIKKDKDKVKEQKGLQSGLRKVSDTQRPRPLSTSLSRPSTSAGYSSAERSTVKGKAAALPRLKTQRSIASLFTTVNDTLPNSVISEPITRSTSSQPPSSFRPPKVKMDVEKPTNSSGSKPKRSSKVQFDDDINNKKPDTFMENNVWLTRSGTRVHPYSKDVPYMQAYDITCLDNDHYSDLLLQRLNPGSPSFFDYGKKPPSTVLDLGCGQGHWVLHAAYIWKNSQVTGLDMVDVTLPAFETTDNVSFVRGNLLLKLPFPAKSFEYVRMANLSLCIPYSQWGAVLTEVRRVLTTGGRLELIDDQIFFPYGETPKIGEASVKHESSKGCSTFDIDDDSDSLEDDDTLEDDTSTSTTSTLVSDRESNSFSEKKGDSIPVTVIAPSPTVTQTTFNSNNQKPVVHPSPTLTPANLKTNLPQPAIPPSPTLTQATINGIHAAESDMAFSSILTTSVTDTVRHGHRKTQSSSSTKSNIEASSAWLHKAQASQDLEIVYEKLLSKVYGIHVRPSEFVLDTMRQVFGKGNSGKIRSYHVKLAPYDSPIGPGGAMSVNAHVTEAGMKGEKETKYSTGLSDHHKKNWIGIEWEKKEKNRDKKKSEKGEGGTTGGRTSLDDPVYPVSVNAKAANRLGLSHTVIPVTKTTSMDSTSSSGSSRRSESPSSSDPSSLDLPTPVPLPVVTPKAAARLGIPCTAPPPLPPKLTNPSQSNSSDNSDQGSSRENLKPPSMNTKAAGRFRVPFAEPVVIERTPSATTSSSTRLCADSINLTPSIHNAKSSGRSAAPYPTNVVSTSETSDSSHSNSSDHYHYSHFAHPPVLSAKAAGRLGISYSMLAAAAASQGRSSGVMTPVQSPGLLVWPSTYISISPVELEMHACKYVQTLLGCRHALREYITGEFEGQALVADEEFNEAMWEYECFRRARFHWPDDTPELFDEDNFPDFPNAAPSKGHSRSNSSDSFNGQYRRDDLTHVRTIRVFEAVKADEKSLVAMLFPGQAKIPGT